MEGKHEMKVPDGKFLRVKVKYEEKIKDVIITGDFFVYPDDIITEIEEKLKNLPVNTSKEELITIIEKAKDDYKGEFLGITSEAIAQSVREAMK